MPLLRRRPTLQALPKTIPVVASSSAAAVARSLGFRTVYTLRPGQSLALLGGALTVRATAGALVGPPWSQRELGLVLQENLEGGARGTSLYYEPHAGGVWGGGLEGQPGRRASGGGKAA